jgi:hypothetical protein
MEVITNDRLVRRNARIGQISSLVALAILAGGMVLSFTKPEYFNLSMLALLVGFVLSQIGIYFGNRWGRRPRPDEQINQALKGLDGRYTLYNYTTPTAHLLVGPAGVWVLIPGNQRGTITFEKGRWRQKGGNWYLKLFAQEGLGRPDLEIVNAVESVTKYLKKMLPEEEMPAIRAALVFTQEKVEINAEGATTPTLYAKKLKDFIRKAAKSKPLPLEKVKRIQQVLASGQSFIHTTEPADQTETE